MKKRTEELKRMLSALAVADAGEMLSRRGKHRLLGTVAADAAQMETGDAHPAVETVSQPRQQVALWLDHCVSAAVLRYALSTARRMEMDLSILCTDAGRSALLLKDWHDELEKSGIHWQIQALPGNPEQALVEHVSRNARVMFMVFSGADSALANLARNRMATRMGSHPHIPLVVVSDPVATASNDAEALPVERAAGQA